MKRPLMMTARLVVVTALAAALTASPARGQTARDPAMAEALFASAKSLLERGDWPGACAKFQASMDLDPAVSTALKIARCHEHEGKLALAWSDVGAALKLNQAIVQPEPRRKELEGYASKLLAALGARVPRLRVRAPSTPPGLRLAYDGRALPIESLGEPLPVDPGEHEIRADAEGYLPLRRTVTLAEGQALDVDLILEAVAPAPTSTSTSTPTLVPPLARTSPPKATSEIPERADRGAARRAAGIGVGAFGVAALGAAGVLGLLTQREVSDAAPYCAPDFSTCHDARGLDALDDARALQTAAFVLLGVGAAAAGTGAALFFTAPRGAGSPPPRPSLTATLGPLGATLRGSF